MSSLARKVLVFCAILTLVFGAGFALQMPWATWLWPWPDGRLSYIFIGSIAAAIGAPILWAGARGVSSSLPGGALNMIPGMGGMAWYIFTIYARDGGVRPLITASVLGALALINIWILLATINLPPSDQRKTPLPVRLSFAVFILALILVGVALLLRAPHVFPWPLNPDSSVMFGFIFLGAAFYFLYALVRPFWVNAFGPLVGFIAYDLVVLYPYARHFETVKPEHLPSLIVYMAVIVYSLMLALYYLFIHPGTRIGGMAAAGSQK